MKKLIALLLAASMLLTMTACGGDAKSAETAAPTAATEASTEPVETEPGIYYPADSEIDAALQDAESAVLSWPSNDTYTMVLRGLGYKEADFSNHIIGDGGTNFDKDGNVSPSPIPSATVHNIQFLDDVVRVELSWYEHEDRYEEDGWVLYCTKADAIADISGINIQDYDGCEIMNFADYFEDWAQKSDFVQMCHFSYFKGIEAWAEVCAYYYPDSGNLYNFVKTYDYFPETIASPDVLCRDAEVAEDYLLNSEVELTFVDGYPVVTSEFKIICDDKEETYQYRVGMSLAAWAVSELNTDGWILGSDNKLFSPDHQYWLECTDFRLEQSSSGTVLSGIRSTAEHKNALAKSLEADTASAYLVDWQTALLPTGFAVVGESAAEEQIAYGMYDMGYGCESGEVFKIYMRNVHPSLLADVKVYAVPDNGEKTIPDNAKCFTFEDAQTLSEKDARFGITMAEATYDMTADPNVTPDGDFAFAITYQDKLVYWIQLGQ